MNIYPQKMQELHVRFISDVGFYVVRLECNPSTIFELETSSPCFVLNDDGGLPKELYQYLVKITGISLDKLKLHVVEVD